MQHFLTLQYCIAFAIYQHESTHPEPSSLLPPRTIPLGRPSAPAPSIMTAQTLVKVTHDLLDA